MFDYPTTRPGGRVSGAPLTRSAQRAFPQPTPGFGYCTSEQMDLMRQVFDEVDRKTRKDTLRTNMRQGER
jgi:hypothetical protein